MGLRVLGDHPQAGRLGEGDVPETVRDRDELSADEPVPDSDDDEEVQRAVPVRGDRLVAEEPVGLASSLRPVEPTAGWSTVQLGSPARERMLLWLERVAETMYGLVDTIATERDMPELVPS